MSNSTTLELAKTITWQGSKQAFYTARLMVDRDLVDDFLRAYACFRWMDDVIDITSSSEEERIGFTDRQNQLIDILRRSSNNMIVTTMSTQESLSCICDHLRVLCWFWPTT